jgi:hypothetical protein
MSDTIGILGLGLIDSGRNEKIWGKSTKND